MKSLNIFKKASIALTALFASIMVSGAVVQALPYTGSTTQNSPVPAFNVFTPTSGNPLPAPAPSAGEKDFFQGRVPVNGDPADATTPYTDPVNAGACTNGKNIQLHIYVHNGASADANNNGNGPSVAHGTKVKVALPTNQANSFNSTATISANNAGTVNDGLTINCNGKTVKLQYVAGSASQYSTGSGVLPLSDSIVTSGAPIQSEHTSGDVWGCWNERVYVVLTVKIVEVPVTPPAVTAVCTLFKIEASSDRKVTVTQFEYTAKNATFKNAIISWGDDASTAPITTAASVNGQTHQYGVDGTYKVAATVNFTNDVDGSTITSLPSQTTCYQNVTFSSNKPPVVVPPVTPPTQLVNTGAGSVVGIAAAVTAASAIGYRLLLSRKLAR